MITTGCFIIIRMTASFLLCLNYIPLVFRFANGYNLYHDMNFENIMKKKLKTDFYTMI